MFTPRTAMNLIVALPVALFIGSAHFSCALTCRAFTAIGAIARSSECPLTAHNLRFRF
jgi:hypothetical protein